MSADFTIHIWHWRLMSEYFTLTPFKDMLDGEFLIEAVAMIYIFVS